MQYQMIIRTGPPWCISTQL